MNAQNELNLDAFEVLVGLRLSIVRRVVDMLVLHFGTVRPAGDGTVGDFALHVQCPWRIDGPGYALVGSSDLGRYAGPAPRPANWSYEDGNSLQDWGFDELIGSYDETTRSWYNMGDRLAVTATLLSLRGDVKLYLSSGHTLLLFPDGRAREAWRFFAPGDEHHLVSPGSTSNRDV